MNVIHYEASTVPPQTTENGVSAQKLLKINKRPVDIEFENVSFTASLGLWKGEKEILHNVHGKFPAGKLVAIMGPSGAGKSTLLDVLSGYRITGVGGVVSVDDVARDLNSFRRMSCYIQQDDRLQPLLTTWETMILAADLKLPVNTTKQHKVSIVTEILKTLGLIESRDTRAGMLSGGQKKRLSIALELINNPLIMFLDEPTTGLDSSTCKQVVQLLKTLSGQGRTIVCTIHQPSASLFQIFDQVYVLAAGRCVYQGGTEKLVSFLESAGMPCPKYHNPADYVIELACGEHGDDKIETLIEATGNGNKWDWFQNASTLELFRAQNGVNGVGNKQCVESRQHSLQETHLLNQIGVLLRQGYIKAIRDPTLTHMRLMVNILTGIMLGVLYINSGDDGSRVINNYNLMFAILIHHMMSTMMLTILTFPRELNILIKEHFNRWYSLKAYYTAMTIVDLPVTIVGCFFFTVIIYFLSGQLHETDRFTMFFVISLLVVLTAQGFGLMVGAVCNVVNGTFLGPTLSVPIMMFAGFGVVIKDLPTAMRWGTHVSYLKYALEGYVGAIYGKNRESLTCPDDSFCLYRRISAFLKDVDMKADQFWTDVYALIGFVLLFRILAFVLLKWKLASIR